MRFLVWLWAAALAPQVPESLSDSGLAALSAQLSEPSGYFDTDNLISNEDSYLHPIGTLKRIGVSGGVYVGVGPDQNFSYIAAVRPRAAFIVDIRRDNLLEHLLFRAVFSLSRNRAEYLSLLFGKRAPRDTAGWGAKDGASLLKYVDTARADTAAVSRVLAEVRRGWQPLARADIETITRYHKTFIAEGPSLKFNTFGRAPNPNYPDFRDLVLAKDRTGRQSSYLAHEEEWLVVKDLERRNLVIPVVGDFGGDKALAAVAKWVADHGDKVSVFYTSNVEQYLFRSGSFARFARAVTAMPRDGKSVIVRSCFMCRGHEQAVAGFNSVQLVQRMGAFASLVAGGGITTYADLLTRDLADPR